METVRAARARHYAASGFSEAAYADRWVVVRVGRVPFAFPNFAARRRAIPLHDLHHVATGYATTPTGEAEISAWELGAGAARHAAAWLFALAGVAGGLVLAPRRTFRAFVRGRHGTNLYHQGWSDDLLDLAVDELRARLALDREPPRATWRDALAFVALPAVTLIAVLRA
jgi:hypothetical protein